MPYFGILAVIALIFMIMAYSFKHSSFLFGAAIFWVVAGIWIRGYTVADWDIYYVLFFTCVLGMVLLCVFEAVILGTRPPGEGKHDDIEISQLDHTQKQMDALWEGTEIPRIGRRASTERRRQQKEK